MRRHRVIVVFLFLIMVATGFSMDFKRLSIEDGLSNSVVFSLTQDNKGIMWFGTRAGVDSYDGAQFKHFNLSVDQDALPAQARHLLYDSKSNLWVGTTNGLFIYHPELEDFQVASAKFKKFQNFKIFRLREDNQNRLWIGTINSLYVFNHETDSLRQIQEFAIPVNDILCPSDNYTVVATIRGVFKISNTDFTVSPISSVKSINDTFSNEFVSALFLDDEKRIWISVLKKGLFIYDPKNEKLIHVDAVQKHIASGNVIWDIEQINNDEYLISIDGNGLISLNSNLTLKNHFLHDEDDDRSLSINSLYEIYVDTDNRIWISTYGGGVNLYDPHILPFSQIEHETNKSNSISNNTGRIVYEDQYKHLWFGTKKGISIYFPEENKWKHIFNTPENPTILGENTIISCCQVSPDEIWFGSYGGGIDRINTKTFEVTPLFPRDKVESILGSSYIYSIYKSKDADIWISTLRSQLVRYNPETKEIRRYPVRNIQQIKETESGELIIASKNGLQLLNKESGISKQYYHIPDDSTSISSDEVYTTLTTGDGKMYIGTEAGGLNVFDPETEKFIHFTKENGPPSNSVYGILEDDSGMLWLSTSHGISMFNPKLESFVNYDSSDGLPITEFYNGSACKTSDGKIIFGGTKGFVSFYPDQIKKITLPPKLIFTDLKISNLSVKIDPQNGPLFTNIDLTENLSLKYKHNSFSISFIGVNYTNIIKNLYSWKLENFEKEWSPPVNEKSATYTNIPPGNYIFRVRSTNIQDGWNGNERSIKIKVNPPFYRTLWAILIYAVIATAIALSVFKYQSIRYQEKHAKEKVQFFVNLAHDLRTPLTLIQSPLSKLLENNSLNETDKQYLNLSQRNAGKLAQLFNQLLDFQKADMRKMQLQVDEYDIVEHLRNVILAFQPLLDKKKIECNLKTDSEKLRLWFDIQKMDKVFYNLFSNAIKYTRENGKIDVALSSGKNHCSVEIKDNGIGIPPAQQKNVFKSYFRATNAINSAETGSGVGLILVKQLIELHKGEISFESAPNEGTTLRIRILTGNKHYQATDFLNDAEKATSIISKPGKIYVPEAFLEQDINGKDAEEEKSRNPKVVIAEDNDELRNFLINSLQHLYRVHGSPNGKDALSFIEKNHPDIIISDIMMPEMDGTTLCVHLKSHIETCHIPVILLTALTDADYKIEGYEVGADAYLEKPFEIKVLLSRIENLLKSRELLKDKFLKYNEPTEKIDFKSKIDQEFIQKAVQIVNDNISDSDFSVEKLCKLIFMSRPVLYRKLKALLDQSPQDFIKIIRLKKAVEYMCKSDMNITEIAYQTGFSDPKYFTTCFKKHFGVSPSTYIRQI